jgi:hypothetical protein
LRQVADRGLSAIPLDYAVDLLYREVVVELLRRSSTQRPSCDRSKRVQRVAVLSVRIHFASPSVKARFFPFQCRNLRARQIPVVSAIAGGV